MAEAVVTIVVGRLTDLLSEEAQFFHGVKDEIEQVITELRRMKTFLRDADSRASENTICILLAEVRQLAYDAEHVTETFLLSSETKRKQQEIKYTIKIKDIERKISLFSNRFRDCNIKSTLESPESSISTHGKLNRFHTFTTVEPEIFVGYQGDLDRLVGYLVDESADCYPVIAICGMGGLGKTTLAQKIYTHPTIKTYFAGLAWVSISQKWQTKHVLQRILICLIHEKKKEILTWDEDKLVENLLQIQQNKKCLVVLDDIWSTDAWDSLKVAFTAEKSISKLMITSRNVNVAEYVNPKGLIHQPEPLSADQSWELLQLKALSPRGDYLDVARDVKRMEELGREMVVHCFGLPLAVVILGGILVTKPSLMEWEKVYTDSLSSIKSKKGFGDDYQRELLDILLWSYNDLPPQLKPCFLYLGKFGEDVWIGTETLYQLWIAEGIVLSSDKREGETMMQVAESYMGELVLRSMVQVRSNDMKSFISTKFESCCLHDLMRDLSLSQAKAEDFFEVVDLQEANQYHLDPSMDLRSAYTRQLVINRYKVNTSKHIDPHIVRKANQYRSMLLFSKFEIGGMPPVLGLHVARFRFLRVFSMENVRTASTTFFRLNLGRVLGSLVYLRYLSVRNTHLLVFPSIQKSVLLETLKLDTPTSYVYPGIYFPPWRSRNILDKLGHLRHLYLPSVYVHSLGRNLNLRFDGLCNLETLENFDDCWCEIKDIAKLTSLRRLKLTVRGKSHVEDVMKYLSSTSCFQYMALRIISIYDEGFRINLDILRELLCNHKFKLEEFSVSGKLPELSRLFEQKRVDIDVSLIRITKLTLLNSRLEKDPMPVLENIPTLMDLKIIDAYEGKEMVCSATGFAKLTRLSLMSLPNMEKWILEVGSMPSLEYLFIDKCRKLEELPDALRFLKSLDTLLLRRMPSYFYAKFHMVNGEQGPDFYKIAHIPVFSIIPKK